MALGEAQPLGLAFNVCIRCKGRKKKCDKVLPSCSRCSRLQVRCQYSPPEPRGLASPPESVAVGSDTYVAILQDHNRNFFPELINSDSFLTPQSVFSIRSGEQQAFSLDEQLTEQCCDIMSRDGDDIQVSCSRYFDYVHAWYPILAKVGFYDRLLRLQSSPHGDFSLLVLTIYLVSQIYRQIPRDRHDLDRLYHTTKGFYFIFMSTGRSSIEVIQAGLLLAFYEYCQALHDATYQTLGACARMGYSLGLDKSLSQDTFPDTQDNSVAERQRQVWWGIIILERISMLEYIDKKLPFAIPTPLPTDILPSDDGTREPASQGLNLQGATSTNVSLELSVYARIAQGAFLLSYVIERISGTDPNTSSCSASYLDNALRSFAMTVLQPSGHGHFCWPYSICLSALLSLSRFEVSAESWPEENTNIFRSRAALGLQSVLRMCLEGTSESSSVSDAETMSIPIWAFHRTYLSTLFSLELESVDEDREKWTMHTQTVKRILKALEPRCKLAGDYLKAIEDRESCRAQKICCQQLNEPIQASFACSSP